MPMKQPQKKVYKTSQGKIVDMDMLRQRNELTPAVGNARVNARGDELGSGGKVIRKREDVLKEYYDTAQGVADQTPIRKPKSSAQTPVVEENDWVEDDEGNFVPKEETKTVKRGR
jgi:hypothetical protein